MANENIIGGVTRHKLRGINTAGQVNYILPLCQFNGFIPKLIPEFNLVQTTNLEIILANVQMSEIPIKKGYWLQWEMFYTEYRLGISDSEAILDIINWQQLYDWTFYPSFDDNPEWNYPVNIIAEEISPRPYKASPNAIGMRGFKLTVRTKDLQKSINIPRIPVEYLGVEDDSGWAPVGY